MEEIRYIPLTEDYFVYIPYVKTKISLDVNSLKYSTDVLSMIILYMKQDFKSDEDIALVTNLNIGIIQEVKQNLVKEGLLKQEDYSLTDASIKILDIYDNISMLESQLKACYSNLLLRKVEDNINECNLVNKVDSVENAVVIFGKNVFYIENFDGAEELVDKYLEKAQKNALAEHFEVNIRVVSKEIQYLQKKIKKLPIIYEKGMFNPKSQINDNIENYLTVAIPCLKIELKLNGTKSIICYQEPFEGNIFETAEELFTEPKHAYLKISNDSCFLTNCDLNLSKIEKFLSYKYDIEGVNSKDLIMQTQNIDCFLNVEQSVLGDN